MNTEKVKGLIAELEGDLNSLYYDVETIKAEILKDDLLGIMVKLGKIVAEIKGDGQ
jgi:hypothetical protein